MVVSPEIEQTLAGKPFTMETLKAAASLVEEVVSPIDDIRASAEYRRWLAGALLVRLGEHTCRAL
jgi:xanthine dehydrogenase FAD-binding subunit